MQNILVYAAATFFEERIRYDACHGKKRCNDAEKFPRLVVPRSSSGYIPMACQLSGMNCYDCTVTEGHGHNPMAFFYAVLYY